MIVGRRWNYNARPDVPFELNRGSPQAKGLVAWFPAGFNPTLRSRVGSVYGALGGAVTWGSSIFGPALNFPSTAAADKVDLSNEPSLAGEMSISAWIRATTIEVGNNYIVADYDVAGLLSQYAFTLNSGGGGKLNAAHGNVGVVTGNKVHVVNTWYHVAAVRSGTTGAWTWTVYSNGIYDNADSTATNPSAQQGAAIGAPGVYVASDLTWTGQITDVRLYNRALGAAEVWALYNPQTRWDLYAGPTRAWTPGHVAFGPYYYLGKYRYESRLEPCECTLGMGQEQFRRELRTAQGALRRHVIAVKRTWTLRWTWLPNHSRRTYHGGLGRDELVALYNDTADTPPVPLQFYVPDGGGESVQVLFVPGSWREKLLQRDGPHGTVYNLAFSLVEV